MNNKRGFTLVELIAVIAILGVLLLIAVPSISKIQEGVDKSQITKDLTTFKSLADYLIKSDTSKTPDGAGKITVNLSEIDKSKLSGEYSSGWVIATDCGFSGSDDIFSCATLTSSLESDKLTATESGGTITITRRGS